MKFTRLQIVKLLVLIVVLLSVSSVQAHHSSAPHFDDSKKVEVTGKFTQMKFVNPHAYLYFEVEQDGETVPWRCELTAATQLKRLGWASDMFSVGQEFTVFGTPARREENVCFLKSIKLADGTEIARNGTVEKSEAPVAAATAADKERATVLANGQPNLQGPWVTLSFGRRATEGIRPRYEPSDAGKQAVGSYDMAFDDPILKCHYVNLINGWNHDENVNEIYQSNDSIKIQYGFMDTVRTVHLNMDKHPAQITPSSTGHSIGSWDGDVLVVDTVGFEEGILEHRSGMKHSDQMHVVERFRFDASTKRLYRDYTLTDPLYLVGEAVGQDVMALSETPYVPYACEELSGKNNIRPGDELYNQIDNTGQPVAAVIQTSDAPEEVEVRASEIKTDTGKKGGSFSGAVIFLLAIALFTRRRSESNRV